MDRSIFITNQKPNVTTEFFSPDTLEHCGDKKHFLNYKKPINYKFNKYGYRDYEWPNDLEDVIWCVGDSATMGVGQPFEESWPQILQAKIGKRCMNLGEAGCSNDTISQRVQEICKLYNPKLVIVMWSFFSRRKIGNKDVAYDKNDFGNKQDMDNFLKNYTTVNNLPTTIINSMYSKVFMGDWTEYVLERSMDASQIKYIEIIDRARDYDHFDVKTSSRFVDWIYNKIKNIDNLSSKPV
jgi:hypothetical protein